MIEFFRLLKRKYSPYSGTGAALVGGRWNPAGVAAVYAAQSRALALCEVLVHLNDLPGDEMVIARFEVDERLIEQGPPIRMTAGLRMQSAGSAFLAAALRRIESKSSGPVVLAIPSAVVPRERCYVFPPEAVESGLVRLREIEPFDLDFRLFR